MERDENWQAALTKFLEALTELVKMATEKLKKEQS